MTDQEIKELIKLVKTQEEQVRGLKQAVLRLQQQLNAVSNIANRAQGQTRRVTEEVRGIQHKLRKE